MEFNDAVLYVLIGIFIVCLIGLVVLWYRTSSEKEIKHLKKDIERLEIDLSFANEELVSLKNTLNNMSEIIRVNEKIVRENPLVAELMIKELASITQKWGQ